MEKETTERGNPPTGSSGSELVPLLEQDVTWKYITSMADAGAIPSRYKGEPMQILTVMKTGRELGVQPHEAINEIYMVNGRPSISGKLLAALIWRAGHMIICDPQPDVATVSSYRLMKDGRYLRMPDVTFSLADAETADLIAKDNWAGYPKAMMAWRAITMAARLHFPDVISSFGYVPEELGMDRVEEIEGEGLLVTELDAEVVEVIEAAVPEPEAIEMAEVVEDYG